MTAIQSHSLTTTTTSTSGVCIVAVDIVLAVVSHFSPIFPLFTSLDCLFFCVTDAPKHPPHSSHIHLHLHHIHTSNVHWYETKRAEAGVWIYETHKWQSHYIASTRPKTFLSLLRHCRYGNHVEMIILPRMSFCLLIKSITCRNISVIIIILDSASSHYTAEKGKNEE